MLGSALRDVVLQVLKLSKDQSVYILLNFNITFPPTPRPLMWYFGKNFLSMSDPTFSAYSVQSTYCACIQPTLIMVRDEYKGNTVLVHDAKEFYITEDTEKKKVREHFIHERKKERKKTKRKKKKERTILIKTRFSVWNITVR